MSQDCFTGVVPDPNIMSSQTITLFTATATKRNGPSALFVSFLLHGAAFALVSISLAQTTRVSERPIKERYTLRLLELHNVELQKNRSVTGSVASPNHHSSSRPDMALAAPTSAGPATLSSVPQQPVQLLLSHRTLVQPDIPPNVVLPRDIPIPAAFLWSSANSQIKKLVPPSKRIPPASDVPPSLDPPNHELNLADLKVSSTRFVTVVPAPSPATTSPLSVPEAQSNPQLPQIASSASQTPTPARVISISQLQVSDGVIPLPPANEAAPANSQGGLTSAHGTSGQQTGSSNSNSRQTGVDAGQVSGDKGEKSAALVSSEAGNGANARTGHTTDGNSSSDSSGQTSVSRISLPKDGQFGVVVVGSSLGDKFPEALGTWGDRLAYTVYIHSGLAKNWILQYSLPSSAAAVAAADNVRPDAPWPFYIVVPQIAIDELNADAIMVHGFVNTAGRFEKLMVVSPPDFARADFVLSTLREWQFRPAMRNRQVTTVEVLLIIPEQPD
jgi:hypothetical protein